MARPLAPAAGNLAAESRPARRAFRIGAGPLFILPTMALLAILILYPVVSTVILSFTDAAGRYVGGDNYAAAFRSSSTIRVIFNTIYYVAGSVILQLVIGVAAGILLNQKFRGRAVVRSLMLIPWVIPGIVAAMTWAWMFHTDYGIVNYALVSLGIIDQPVGWLTNPSTVMPALIAVNAWKMFPFVAVMVLAGLQSVPEELYEAARVDGAQFRHEVWHIMLPQLRPVLVAITLLLVIWGLDGITIIYSMTGGGPAGRSMIFPIQIYAMAFEFFEFNRAAALSVVYFLLIVGLIALYLRAFAPQENE